MWEAFEQACPSLDLDGLNKISEQMKVFILCEMTDGASSCLRREFVYSMQLPHNCLYMHNLTCTAHRIHRIIEYAIDEPNLVGDIHAIALVASRPGYRAKLIAAAKELVQEELMIIDCDDPAWATSREHMLRHTFPGLRAGDDEPPE